MEKKSNLKTTEKTLIVLEKFIEKEERGVTELSKELQWSKSMVHRILSTLKNNGFLRQDRQTQKYKLGYKLLTLGRIANKSFNLKELADEDMNLLADKTKETVILQVISDLSAVCIKKVERTSRGIKCTSEVGKKVPLYASASSKVLLAYSSDDRIEKVIEKGLEKITDKTIAEPNKLKKDLSKIKKKGFCISFGELDYGSVGISLPIFNNRQDIEASISIIGPEFRMKKNIDKHLELGYEVANNITQKLGGKIQRGKIKCQN